MEQLGVKIILCHFSYKQLTKKILDGKMSFASYLVKIWIFFLSDERVSPWNNLGLKSFCVIFLTSSSQRKFWMVKCHLHPT